jgi:hypothetical protein
MVDKATRRMGRPPGTVSTSPTFGCGHPRTPENSLKNAHRDDQIGTRCRECIRIKSADKASRERAARAGARYAGRVIDGVLAVTWELEEFVVYVGDRVDWERDWWALRDAKATDVICASCLSDARRLWWLSMHLYACMSEACSLVFSSGPRHLRREVLAVALADLENGDSAQAVANRHGISRGAAHNARAIRRATTGGNHGT